MKSIIELSETNFETKMLKAASKTVIAGPRQGETQKMIPRTLIDAAIGAGLDFGWHKLAGCSTGASPLTSNPFISRLHGVVVGGLIATSFH